MPDHERGTTPPNDRTSSREDWKSPFDLLGELDARFLQIWREALILQDGRYGSKALLKIIALAMKDQDFRRRLLADPDGVIAELRGDNDLPRDVTIRFFANSSEMLNVVIPERIDDSVRQRPELRDFLRSRTTMDAATTRNMFKDDFDIGNFDSSDIMGDPEYKDEYYEY